MAKNELRSVDTYKKEIKGDTSHVRNVFEKHGNSNEPVSEKVKKIFKSVDADGSGQIDSVEMRKLLKSWGITGIDHNSLVESFMHGNPKLRKQKALNLSEFNNFMLFFFSVREVFDNFKKVDGISIHLSELNNLLIKFGYHFDPDIMGKFLELFDYDKSGTLEFNEILGLMLYLNRLEFYYNDEDRDGSHSLDEGELQSLLRALRIHVSVQEMKAVMSHMPPGKMENLNFDNFVDLLFYIKDTIPKVKEKANAHRKANKQKPFKRKKAKDNELAQQLAAVVAEEVPKGEALAAQCKRAGKKWVDPDFPTNNNSVFPFAKERGAVIDRWVRPEQIAPSPSLFVDGVDEGDVIQGRLGDCYLLSAFCVLACAGNDEIEKLFVGRWPEQGIFQVRFYKNRHWHVVTVDDQVPIDQNGLVFFSQCRDINEYWVQILEKAYAKLHGSYESIEHGVISDALVDLTGEPSEVFTPVEDSDEMWDKMIYFIQEGYLMGCNYESDEGDPNEPTDMGLLHNHAYGILDIQEVEGHRLIRLRNPWGSYEWTGAWSDGSCEWTDELQAHFNFEFGDDGTFFMEFHDFCENFTHFISVRMLGSKWDKKYFVGEWKNPDSAGGCLNHPTWMKNPQFKILCPSSRKVFVSCMQEDGRLRTHKYFDYPSSGITVLRRNDNNNVVQETMSSRADIHSISKFIQTRESSLGFTAEPNQPYTIIVSTYNAGIEGRWYVLVATLGTAEVVELSQKKPSTSIKGEWVGEKAAGCPDWNTWRDGTQYFLIVREGGEKNVTIVQGRKQDNMAQIGYYIFPSNPEKLPVLDKDTKLHSCQFVNSSTVSNTYNLERGLYVILPCTFRPNFENQYGLVVQGAGCELKAMPNNWEISVLAGQWTSTLCGGCGNNNNKDYIKNPIIHFRLDEPKTVLYFLLQIDQYAEINGIGFYLFETDDSGELAKRLERSDFKTEKEGTVTKRFELGPGDYAILPVTYTKGVIGLWTLTSYSTTPIKMRQTNK